MSLEEIILMVAEGLRDLGFLLYGGPMVAFTLLVSGRRLIPHVRSWDVVRVYRAWGPGFGLSLGACILGALVTHYLQQGSFTWPIDTAAQQVAAGAWLAFFAMWVSNLQLEVWTLQPLRSLDQDGVIADETAYEQQADRLRGHMLVHSGLIVTTVVLAQISSSLG